MELYQRFLHIETPFITEILWKVLRQRLNVWDGEATGSVVDEEYQVKINSIGTSNYQIQLIQTGLILEQGKYYEVSFGLCRLIERSKST